MQTSVCTLNVRYFHFLYFMPHCIVHLPLLLPLCPLPLPSSSPSLPPHSMYMPLHLPVPLPFPPLCASLPCLLSPYDPDLLLCLCSTATTQAGRLRSCKKLSQFAPFHSKRDSHRHSTWSEHTHKHLPCPAVAHTVVHTCVFRCSMHNPCSTVVLPPRPSCGTLVQRTAHLLFAQESKPPLQFQVASLTCSLGECWDTLHLFQGRAEGIAGSVRTTHTQDTVCT